MPRTVKRWRDGSRPEARVLIFRRSNGTAIETKRLTLRLPEMGDHASWAMLRRRGEAFLRPWEPAWSSDHLTRRAFRNRVYWAWRAREEGRALALFLVRREDARLVGAITLDNIRRGPAQSAQVGYWIGPDYARQGLMREALDGLVQHAFGTLDLGRVEAACLPENAASRALLDSAGFRHEGVARCYLQINGRWRDHVLYASLRSDRAAEVQGA
jgi:ribosomal-protein-alanine N-acetyltransferase